MNTTPFERGDLVKVKGTENVGTVIRRKTIPNYPDEYRIQFPHKDRWVEDTDLELVKEKNA